MKRVLCIIGSMDAGGAETMLMKLYRQMNHEEVQFDYFLTTMDIGFYEEEIKKMGGIIHRIAPQRPIKTCIAIYKSIKKNKYDYVLQSTQLADHTVYLIAAKLAGAQYLALRSTNSKSCRGKLADFIEKKLQFMSRFSSNIRFAPSNLAADFMFGENAVQKYNVHILRNGLNLKKFAYVDEYRNIARKQLGLSDRFIVGHVGRLSMQKNHEYLVKVFHEIYKHKKEAVLLLIGTGELEKKIKKQALSLGITDKVIFAGVRSDVNECLMAMDVMVFPSFYEGMPNVVIEAQTTGLPCIVSDTITEECQVTDRVRFMSLNNSPEQWAKGAIEFASIPVNRSDYAEKMRQAGYDIKDVADEFAKYMFE